MRLRIGVLALAAALSLGACTSGGSHNAASSSPAASTSSATSSASSSSPAATTGSDTVANDPYCAKVADWGSKFQQLETAITSNQPSQLKTAFTQATEFFSGLRDGAPAAVAGSIDTINSTLGQVASDFSGSAAPSTSTISSLTAKLTAPIETFTQWVATNCSPS